MKIILVGGGKVGTALARQLSEEGHNVTVVDTNKARVEHLTESYDVLGIVGNGSSITTLSEAGIEDADVFIAVTGSDELNLLCCMFAKRRVTATALPVCATRPTAMSWTLSKADRHFRHHQPGNGSGKGDLPSAAVPRCQQDRYLCGWPCAADQVCAARCTGRRSHPRDPHPAQERYSGVRGGA